jgi:hypothetical protein
MPSSSMMHAVQRHKDVLEDYRRDYGRTKVGDFTVAFMRLLALSVRDGLK